MGAIERKLLQFPEQVFVLKCCKCRNNSFDVILNSRDPNDIKHLECCECGDIFIPGKMEEKEEE